MSREFLRPDKVIRWTLARSVFLYEPLDRFNGFKTRLVAGFEQFLSSMRLVPANMAHLRNDDQVGFRAVLVRNDFFHGHENLGKHSKDGSRRFNKCCTFSTETDDDHDVRAE